MIALSAYPNVCISGQLIFSKAIAVFGFADEALSKTAADSYEKVVEKLFVRLDGSATGRAVLRAIGRISPRMLLVEPLLETVEGRPNGYATPEEKRAARRNGCDTIVSFTPAHWEPNVITAKLTGIQYHYGSGIYPDELLLHEIVHGLRHMAGLRITRKIPFQRGYDKFEEFYAILIANIYRSELGRPSLRLDHHGFQLLASAGIQGQDDFYKYRLNKVHLAKLSRQQPGLFSDLTLVKAAFNPVSLAGSP